MPTYNLYCNADGHAGREGQRGWSAGALIEMSDEPTPEQVAAARHCDACAVALDGKELPEIPPPAEPDPS